MDTDKLHPFGQSVEFYKNLCFCGTHTERKLALEPESKPKIEGIHLHHKDKSN